MKNNLPNLKDFLISTLKFIWKKKFSITVLFPLLFLNVLFFVSTAAMIENAKSDQSAAEICHNADVAQQEYKRIVFDDYSESMSTPYMTMAEKNNMKNREDTAFQGARIMEKICQGTLRLEADRAEMNVLQSKFDISRYENYKKEDKLSIAKMAGLVDSSLSSFSDKLAVLRVFRDHPDLYH